jgi:hypothetical protein
VPAPTDPFAPEVVAAVVAHMVDDHGDDTLRIARAQGGVPEARAARLLTFDADGLTIEAQLADGSVIDVRVPWDTIPTDRTAIRLELVRMVEEADDALAADG